MRSRFPRVAIALVALVLGIVVLASSPGSDALAQRKGGFGQKGERAKEKDVPPPHLTLPDDWVKAFQWRSIGPANMGGRITAIAVYEADPSTYWIATASGGLVKTTNNGVTFEHQFDHEGRVSIGDVCVAPSDRNVVWVGTGENNPRNSVSYGDGVYKSTDGGKTWKHMGLNKTYQTGKIVIHPTNPDIVYVGALGRCYGPNEERGLFKTTDGGKTWEKVLFVDDKTGVIDIRLHPKDPNTIYVATWERQRDEYDSWPGGGLPDGYDAYDPVKKWGPGSGIHKSTDGGKTFKKLTNGLPTCNKGRIGLEVYPKNPDVLYAIIDCEKIGMGVPPKKAAIASNADIGVRGEDAGEDAGAKVLNVFPDGPADRAGLRSEDVITKAGTKAIKTYPELIEFVRSQKVGDKVKFEIKRNEKNETIEVTLGERQGKGGFGGGGGGGGGFGGPGGATAKRPYAANYGGQAANVTDTQGPDSFQYGGVYRSADAGETWKRINSINPRPMYFSLLRVDPTDEKHIYVGGVSLSRSTDGGKTFQTAGRGVHSDHHALWIDPKDGRHQIIGTDGGFYVTYDRGANWDHMNQLALGQFYHVSVCTKKPYWIYGGLQDNGCWGIPSMSLRGPGPVNEDVVPINGGDGYVCRVDPNDPDQVYAESQNGGMVRYNLRTGERQSIKPRNVQGQPPYRFNWNTPHILSSHNSQIWYCGGNFVFKSVHKGDDPKVISPEITRTKHGSATALAESPRSPDVLWAGTDDGNLWVTKDGGKEWKNVAEKVGLKKPLWVATIEASRFAQGRAYVAFDAHRSDDDNPYLYETNDYGETWKPIKANLPTGSTRCLREDVTNPNLLYCGTEFALFVSLDRGSSWTKINNNLPTVAVHEVAIHPTAGEIVAATHGRSLWILEVTALRQMASESVKEKPTLYKPNTLTRWQDMPRRGQSGRRFVGQNPPTTAQVYYSLPKKAEKVSLRFFDIDDKKVGELKVPAEPGLHKAAWDAVARTEAVQQPQGGGLFGIRPEAGQGGGGGGGRGRGQFRAGGRQVPAGSYRVVLVIDGKEEGSHSFAIEGDPSPGRSLSAEDEEDEEEEMDR